MFIDSNHAENKKGNSTNVDDDDDDGDDDYDDEETPVGQALGIEGDAWATC